MLRNLQQISHKPAPSNMAGSPREKPQLSAEEIVGRKELRQRIKLLKDLSEQVCVHINKCEGLVRLAEECEAYSQGNRPKTSRSALLEKMPAGQGYWEGLEEPSTKDLLKEWKAEAVAQKKAAKGARNRLEKMQTQARLRGMPIPVSLGAGEGKRAKNSSKKVLEVLLTATERLEHTLIQCSSWNTAPISGRGFAEPYMMFASLASEMSWGLEIKEEDVRVERWGVQPVLQEVESEMKDLRHFQILLRDTSYGVPLPAAHRRQGNKEMKMEELVTHFEGDIVIPMSVDETLSSAPLSRTLNYYAGYVVTSDNQQAMFTVGWALMNGIACEMDRVLGAQYYQRAAEAGLPDAQYNLALCYEEGLGLERDDGAAASWYQLAASKGHARSMFNLGMCFLNGDGVEKDPTRAFKLWEKAADFGLPQAMFILGECYLRGNLVPRSERTAVQFFEKAAARGSQEAKYHLGMCYQRGYGGLQPNGRKAVELWREAAELTPQTRSKF